MSKSNNVYRRIEYDGYLSRRGATIAWRKETGSNNIPYMTYNINHNEQYTIVVGLI